MLARARAEPAGAVAAMVENELWRVVKWGLEKDIRTTDQMGTVHIPKTGLVWCFHACASTCRWLASEWKHADTKFQIALLVPTGCGCF